MLQDGGEEAGPRCGLSSRSSWEYPTAAQRPHQTRHVTPTTCTGTLTHAQPQPGKLCLARPLRAAGPLPPGPPLLHHLFPGGHSLSPLLRAVQTQRQRWKALNIMNRCGTLPCRHWGQEGSTLGLGWLLCAPPGRQQVGTGSPVTDTLGCGEGWG